ncbi:hypothetical protein AB1N83_010847 [Pleurotus pulmonarius]
MSNADTYSDFWTTSAGRTTLEPSSITFTFATTMAITKMQIYFTTTTMTPTDHIYIHQVSMVPVSILSPRSSTTTSSPSSSSVISSPPSIIHPTPSSSTPTSTIPTTSSSTSLLGLSTNAISPETLPPSSKLVLGVVGVVATLVTVISLVMLLILLRVRRRARRSSENSENVVEEITPFPYSERSPRPESARPTSSLGDDVKTVVDPGSPTSMHPHHGSVSSEMLAIDRTRSSLVNGTQKRTRQKRSICNSLQSMRATVSSSRPNTSDGQALPSSFGSGISSLIANLTNNRP